MLRTSLRRYFGAGVQRQDPTKHFYMNQRNQVLDESYAWVGRVFVPGKLPNKTADYKIQSDVFEHLKAFAAKKTDNDSILKLNWDDVKDNSFGTFGLDYMTTENIKELFDYLGDNVKLPQHPYKFNREKKARKDLHNSLLKVDIKNVDEYVNYETLENFVAEYSSILEEYIRQSSMSLYSRDIKGNTGLGDTEIDVYNLEEKKNEKIVKEYRIRNPVQLVNQLMAFIHMK